MLEAREDANAQINKARQKLLSTEKIIQELADEVKAKEKFVDIVQNTDKVYIFNSCDFQ